jgi:import inner membrane translocase subunit TIM23
MGFLDRLAGRPAKKDAADASGGAGAGAAAPAPPSTSEVLRDSGSHDLPGAVPATRLYDPYEALSALGGGGGAVGAGAAGGAGGPGGPGTSRRLAFQLPEGPEFVFQEEAAVHRRSWGENLQFYTGLGYLAGGAGGFAAGGVKYLRSPAEPSLDTLKLKANRLINSSGSLGKRFACGSAILGLYFSSFESAIASAAGGAAADDALGAACTSAAGFCTAALYRSPRGPRAAAVAGMVGAVGGGVLAALRQRWPAL